MRKGRRIFETGKKNLPQYLYSCCKTATITPERCNYSNYYEFCLIESAIMDRLTPEQRRKNMQAVKSKGSEIEILFTKALYKKGYRYRKNDGTVFGRPDLTFKSLKIAVFIDSEFWHGKDWEMRKADHKTNLEFWHKKIAGNIERDKAVNDNLKSAGWLVLRFWGKDIKKNLDECITLFEQKVAEAKQAKSQ